MSYIRTIINQFKNRFLTASLLRSGSVFAHLKTAPIALTLVFLVIGGIFTPFDLASAQGNTGGPPTVECGGWLSLNVSCWTGNGILIISWAIFQLVGMLLSIAGTLLDASIRFSIDTAQWPKLTIASAWTLVRDTVNVVFVFFLLYIAIMTILQMGNWRRLLATLIVGALLVNFSLFATQVVIDAGNMLAVGIYNHILQNATVNGGQPATLSEMFMTYMQLSTMFNPSQIQEMDFLTRFVGVIMGIILVCITAFIFLTGAILFVLRTVVLILLMVLSPLAFVSYALPNFSGIGKQWFSRLLGESFYAPMFLLMIWLTARILDATSQVNRGEFSTAINTYMRSANPGPGAAAMFMHFAIIAGFLMASLMLSRYITTWSGNMAAGYARRGMGLGLGYGLGYASAVGGKLGRSTIGRGAQAQLDSGKYDKMMESDNRFTRLRGQLYKRAATATAKSNFDARNTVLARGVERAAGFGGVKVNMGKGSTANYNQSVKEAADRQYEFGSKLSRQARELYAQDLEKGGMAGAVFDVSTGSARQAGNAVAAKRIMAPIRMKEIREEYRTGMTKEKDPATGNLIPVAAKRDGINIKSEREVKQQFNDGTHPDLIATGTPGIKALNKELQKLKDDKKRNTPLPAGTTYDDLIENKKEEVDRTKDQLSATLQKEVYDLREDELDALRKKHSL